MSSPQFLCHFPSQGLETINDAMGDHPSNSGELATNKCKGSKVNSMDFMPNNVKLKAEAKKFHAQAMHKLNTFALNIFGMFYSCLGKSIFQS